MFLGDWFSVSIDYLWCELKGEGGLVYTRKGENSMAVSVFGCKIPQ